MRPALTTHLIAALFAGALLLPCQAVEPDLRAKMLAGISAHLAGATADLEREPASLRLLSSRGDDHLFLGQFAEAVVDFERMIALDPAQDAPHWRLGIAYYFASDFAKSARQFEKYHAYDGGDRENGIWKFLAQAKAEGLGKARAGMLTYTHFDREPFPELYEMFAGKLTTEEMLASLETKGLRSDERVAFFSNYYGGLNESLLGRRERALELLARAVDSQWSRAAAGHADYMWQVARLHLEALQKAPVLP